jgi:ComF family protein
MNRLGQHLLRFFLPWACAGCRSALGSLDDHGFCGRCWLSIPRIQGVVCQACGVPLKDGGRFCYACRQEPPSLLVRSATEYRGAIRPAIYRFKYAGRKTLVRPFGGLLRYAWDHSVELHDIQGIIPVPLYPKNERIRGFNQAELLAAQLAFDIGRPMLPLLVRKRETVSQIELNRSERGDNMRAAFDLQPLSGAQREILHGRSFLLVDDVCTTTSTLAECARVLRRAGVRSVKALVLARDL